MDFMKEYHREAVPLSSYSIRGRCQPELITRNVDCDHLVNVVIASLLHYKVAIFPFPNLFIKVILVILLVVFQCILNCFWKPYLWVRFRPAVKTLAFGKDFCLFVKVPEAVREHFNTKSGLRELGGTWVGCWKCDSRPTLSPPHCSHCEGVMIMDPC